MLKPDAIWTKECARIEGLRKEFAAWAEPWKPAKPNESPQAKPGWLTKIERDLCNADRGTVHQIMGEPPRRWEAQPSGSGWRSFTGGNESFYWSGVKGRAR
jgi:hypothetical protein